MPIANGIAAAAPIPPMSPHVISPLPGCRTARPQIDIRFGERDLADFDAKVV
jgi:hypothetical protein